MNNCGEIGHPCRTPLLIWKVLETYPPFLTHDDLSVFKILIQFIKLGPKPNIAKLSRIQGILIESNACLKSIANRIPDAAITMRLRCEVQVSDHQLGVKRPGKAAFTQVSVGRKPGHHGKDDPVYVMLCTAQNRSGTKYVIWKNLRQIFGKFVREGKATLRFLTPPHDLAFSKADPDHLATFLRVIKLVAEGKGLSDESLSSLAPVSLKQVERPVTSLTVMTPSEYPMSFPKSLTILVISNCSLRRVSSHILGLDKLTSLDLSSNQLSSLPEQMSGLKSLNCLSVSHNRINSFPTVLCLSALRKSLVTLDLRHNQIPAVPMCIKECERLQTLHLSSNQLRTLPECLGHMRSLSCLSASDNKLQYLPGSLLRKTWELGDFSSNPFDCAVRQTTPQQSSFPVPSMREWAARCIIEHRVPYSAEDLDWYSIAYVESALFCLCGSSCFEAGVSHTLRQTLRATSTYQGDVPFKLHLCSRRCLKKLHAGKR